MSRPRPSRGDGGGGPAIPLAVTAQVVSGSQNGCVPAALVVYLDSIDETRLDYLDDEEELRSRVAEPLPQYASALLDRPLSLVRQR